VTEGGDSGGLRVLLACEWFVKYTAGLARGLAEQGCEVTLVTRDHDLEFGGEPGAMRAFVASQLDGRARHLELGGRVRELRRYGEVARARRALAGWRPDVVHVQDSLTNDVRLAVAAGYPWRRYALTVHDPAPHLGEPALDAWTRVVRRRLLRGADLVFAHAAVLAEELRAEGKVLGPVEVVPHGFGEVVEAPLPARPSLLFFGRIMRYKGVDTLLDAMPAVWARNPDVTLTVAGSSDEGLSHPVLADPRVTLRDEHVPEAAVPQLFADATCVVLPYLQATQSGVGAEARQFGRAIVATEVGGLPELITPDTGRLVAPGAPEALAAAIAEVVETPGLAAELGRNAAASTGDAGWSSVAEKTLAAYRRHLL
jgi:starch synthase